MLGSRKTVATRASKPKARKAIKTKLKIAVSTLMDTTEEETFSERVLRKVNEKRAQHGEEPLGSAEDKNTSQSKRRKSVITKPQTAEANPNPDSVTARVLEDDNFIDMDISSIRNVFPSDDEDEENNQSEQGSSPDTEVTFNNSVMVRIEQNLSAQRPSSSKQTARDNDPRDGNQQLPHHPSLDPPGSNSPGASPRCANKRKGNRFDELKSTISLMQEFMVEKGIINNTMTEHEIKLFLEQSQAQQGGPERGNERTTGCPPVAKQAISARSKSQGTNPLVQTENRIGNVNTQNPSRGKMTIDSGSEVTLYSRAVKSVADPAQVNLQIEELLKKQGNLMISLMI